MISIRPGTVASAAPFVLFENHLSGATITAGTTAPGFSAASVATENTWQQWKADSLTSHLFFDFGQSRDFDTICIAAHNLASVAGVITAGFRATTGDAWTIPFAPAWPADAAPVAMISGPMISARYAYLHLVNAAPPAPLAPVSIGVVAIGRRLEFPAWQAPDFVRPADAVTIDGDVSLSLEGQYLGATIRRKAGRLAPRLSPVARSWAAANLAAFRAHYDARRPFFYAPGPAAFPGDLVYAWRGQGAGELRPQLMSGGRQVTFAMDMDFHAA